MNKFGWYHNQASTYIPWQQSGGEMMMMILSFWYYLCASNNEKNEKSITHFHENDSGAKERSNLINFLFLFFSFRTFWSTSGVQLTVWASCFTFLWHLQAAWKALHLHTLSFEWLSCMAVHSALTILKQIQQQQQQQDHKAYASFINEHNHRYVGKDTSEKHSHYKYEHFLLLHLIKLV